MSKVDRRIYELNNRNRAAWGQDPLPEPKNGFAEEPRPPYADLLPVVEHWFREATTGQPHRPRRAKLPLEPELTPIAQLIHEWDEGARAPDDPRRPVILEKVRRFQRSVAEMQTSLQEILDLALPGATPDDPAVGRLIDLWNAAQLAEPYIGPAPKQGRQLAAWHVMARALAPLVSAALVSAGYQRPSVKSDGPVVRVICRALNELEGIEHEPNAVASCLKRTRQKGATKN
jgi:hypothetical protein